MISEITMDSAMYVGTRAAIAAWDIYYQQWEADLNKLTASLPIGEFKANGEKVLAHFDTGIKQLCDTVGEAFAADTADTNNRDTVLDTVFGRGTQVVPGVPDWIRELAA